MASLFFKIASGEIPCYKIAESEQFMAFLDVFPIAEGHVLVIPKKETDNIFDIEDDELVGLMLFAKKVAIAVKKAVPCKKVGVAVIGLEVPHAHIHLVPLNEVGDINFSKPKLNPGQDKLAEMAGKISAFI